MTIDRAREYVARYIDAKHSVLEAVDKLLNPMRKDRCPACGTPDVLFPDQPQITAEIAVILLKEAPRNRSL
jgi:hypothetical protein